MRNRKRNQNQYKGLPILTSIRNERGIPDRISVNFLFEGGPKSPAGELYLLVKTAETGWLATGWELPFIDRSGPLSQGRGPAATAAIPAAKDRGKYQDAAAAADINSSIVPPGPGCRCSGHRM